MKNKLNMSAISNTTKEEKSFIKLGREESSFSDQKMPNDFTRGFWGLKKMKSYNTNDK